MDAFLAEDFPYRVNGRIQLLGHGRTVPQSQPFWRRLTEHLEEASAKTVPIRWRSAGARVVMKARQALLDITLSPINDCVGVRVEFLSDPGDRFFGSYRI